uniref:Uncharacterized protein n=1 Tax=Arundo donax TaxID=35708 RepID=A0A0A9FJL7_ARUDO
MLSCKGTIDHVNGFTTTKSAYTDKEYSHVST